MPEVSAGSNQVGASVVCTPQVSCPCGSPARAAPAPKISASARTTNICRRRCLMARLCSPARQREILVGTRIGVAGNEPEPRFLDPRADTAEERLLPQGRVDRPLVHELLNLVQRRRAPCRVEFGRLLGEQRVDLGIAAVDVDAALGDASLEPCRSVAERTALPLDEILQALLGVALKKPRARADAAWRGCPLPG